MSRLEKNKIRPDHSRRVFIAMSGGVDSSVTATILKEQGHEVTGVFIRCFNLDGCAERDAEDARRVAEHLGIPFYVFDLEDDYKREVVDYMVKGYREGRTPNPDVMCNKEIKFGLFLKKALGLGADYIATGHYVRKEKNSLYAAKDKNKDQSYFLWTLTQDQLKHCLFPIGDYLKSEVREIARKAGLPTAEKKDSQGICFLGKVTLDEFLKDYIPEKVGEVKFPTGEKAGEHIGAHFYTIGQRHGIGNIKHEKGNKVHEPVYVSDKNVFTNTVTVVRGENNPALFRKEIELHDLNFINSDDSPISAEGGGVRERRTNLREADRRTNRRIEVLARVRYRQPLAKGFLDGRKLVFNEPQKFVASGQSAVFYSENGEMLGGGIIV